MADVKKTILLELGMNKDEFIKNATQTQKQISDLTAKQKELKKAGQEATVEYQENASSLKLLQGEYREAQKNATNFQKALQESKNATGSLNQLEAELSVLTTRFKELSEGGREWTEEGKAIRQATAEVTEKLKQQKKEIGDNRMNVGNYASAFEGLGGEMKGVVGQMADMNDMGIKTEEVQKAVTIATEIGKAAYNAKKSAIEQTAVAEEAANVQSKAGISIQAAYNLVVGKSVGMLKLFKLALIGTGIGALIVGVGSLIALLAKSQPAIDYVNKLLSATGAIIRVLVDRFATFGQGIVQLFKGDIAGAVESFRGSIKGMGAEIAKEAGDAFNLEGMMQKNTRAQEAFRVEMAQGRAEIERLKFVSEDLRNSEDERTKAAATALGIERGLREKNNRLVTEELSLIKQRNAMGKVNDSNIREEQEAEIKLAEIKADSFGKETELNNKHNELLRSRAEAAKAAGQAAADAEKKRLEEIEDFNKELASMEFDMNLQRKSAADAEIAQVDKKYAELIARAKGNADQLVKIEELYANEVGLINERVEKTRIEQEKEFGVQLLEQRLKRVGDNLKLEHDLKLALLEKQREMELEQEELTEVQKKAIREKYRFEMEQAEIDFNTKAEEKRKELSDRELERERQMAEAKEEFEQRKADAIFTGLNVIQEVFGKQSAIAKLAFGLEKALAIATIVLNTQKALAANRVAEQLQQAAVSGIPFVGPILAAGIAAKSRIERALIIGEGVVSGAAVAATALKYRQGGIHQGDGLVKGPGSGTSDSINARLSNGESVLTAKTTQLFGPILSVMNQIGGGRSFAPVSYSIPKFAAGGIYDGGLTAKYLTPEMNAKEIGNVVSDALIANFPEIWVNVGDVNRENNKIAKVDNRVTY